MFKIEKGLNSTTENYSFLEVLIVKYPNAIFTFDSAFYYQSLRDIITENYHIVTSKDCYKIKQYLSINDFLDYEE